MSELHYLLAVILVMAAATFLTRLIPFVALHHLRDHPLMLFLGRYMPPAVMTILVFYSLKGIDLSVPPFGVGTFIAVAITVAVHIWRRHALLSIAAGTAAYMGILQFGVLA